MKNKPYSNFGGSFSTELSFKKTLYLLQSYEPFMLQNVGPTYGAPIGVYLSG